MTSFEFTFSETFYAEANRRVRRCRKAAKYATAVISLVAAIFVGLTVWSIIEHLYGAAVLGVVLFALLLVAPHVDERTARKRLQQFWQYNQRITIDLLEEEVRSSADKVKTQVLWTIFTKARRFEDGFLLFQGPVHSNWLPTSAIVAGSAEDAHELIKTHVTDYKNV